VIVIVIVGCVLVAVGVVLFVRRRPQHRLHPEDNKHIALNVSRMHAIAVDVYSLLQSDFIRKAMTEDYVSVFDANHEREDNAFMSKEIEMQCVVVLDKLGEGNYGLVRRGELTLQPGETERVAIKSVKDFAPLVEQQKIILEALLMSKLVHTHLVQLIGICSRVQPFLIITEYMQGGSLVSYLSKCRPEACPRVCVLGAKDFISMSYQICSALVYLETKAIVHRDLAARYIRWCTVIDMIDM
jgi:hypothetical protein